MSEFQGFWYYANPDDEQRGPISGDALLDLYVRGRVNRATLIWRDGLPAWLPLARHFDQVMDTLEYKHPA